MIVMIFTCYQFVSLLSGSSLGWRVPFFPLCFYWLYSSKSYTFESSSYSSSVNVFKNALRIVTAPCIVLQAHDFRSIESIFGTSDNCASHVRFLGDYDRLWSIWVNCSVTELLSLWNPGPEIVLYRFDIMSLLADIQHFNFMCSCLQMRVQFYFSHQFHTGSKKAMCPCSKSILIGSNWRLHFLQMAGVIGDSRFNLVPSQAVGR